jgi:fatty-acyl-CoA synthase
VTYTAGVPTVWLMLLQHMAAEKKALPDLKVVICGGSAMPRSMIKSFVDMGCEVRHAWGMTEMSPIGTVGAPGRSQTSPAKPGSISCRPRVIRRSACR